MANTIIKCPKCGEQWQFENDGGTQQRVSSLAERIQSIRALRDELSKITPAGDSTTMIREWRDKHWNPSTPGA